MLTRDRGLLKRRVISHGYWMRATVPRQQFVVAVHAAFVVDVMLGGVLAPRRLQMAWAHVPAAYTPLR
jgi:hypothetical protein